ncbi:MAG: toll/interleukin-1 receptor domain-containing protein [Burkholderiales bacterium]
MFLYDAFISYRHIPRDRTWAEWLIAALESYRVPKVLQDRGLPPRLCKIFRDEDEVAASSDLNDHIKEALKASRFLIVVCSAFTPRSKWVTREIEFFNELGRIDQVLALLTEGEPGDSFPTVLLERPLGAGQQGGSAQQLSEEREPLAADVRPRPGVSYKQIKRFALLDWSRVSSTYPLMICASASTSVSAAGASRGQCSRRRSASSSAARPSAIGK